MPGSFRTIELSDGPFEREGLRFMTVKTPHLQGRGDICLFVPEVETGVTNLPIYLLLHGVYGSAWIWAYKGGAHLTAQRLISQNQIQPAIIAMPSDGLWGDGSAYRVHHGKNFEQWIVSDVPLAIQENIPEAAKNALICIGGLSMGGYGALLLGAKFPQRFAAISAHSAITALTQMELFVEEALESYPLTAELPNAIDAIKKNKAQLPALRFDCGKTDLLIEPNRQLHQQLEEAGIPHQYEEFSGGHEWPYWQTHVEKTFRFFDQVTHEKRTRS